MRLLSRIVPFLLAALVAALWTRPARAADSAATFEITVVQASKDPQAGPVDPRVNPKHFRDSAYKSFQVIGQQSPTVNLNSSQAVPLAGDKQLTVAYQKHVKTGATVHLSIPKVIDTTTTMRPAQQLILGGPKLPYGNGVLFVQVRLTQVK